jgi:hypothetical protein
VRRTVAAALGFVVLVAAVGVAGARSERHLTGTNLMRPFLWSVEIPAGQTACQGQENVPDGTGGIRLRGGTFDRPGPRVEVSVAGAARGVLAAGWRQGDVAIDVPEIHGDRLDSRVCVTNRGPGRLALVGENSPPDRAARIGDAPQPGRARIEYLRPHAESWWGLSGELAARVATVRAAAPGSATLYLWGLLILAVAVGALALVAREGRE